MDIFECPLVTGCIVLDTYLLVEQSDSIIPLSPITSDSFTVKPVFKGHFNIREKVSLHDRCSFVTGSFNMGQIRTPFWESVPWSQGVPSLQCPLKTGFTVYLSLLYNTAIEWWAILLSMSMYISWYAHQCDFSGEIISEYMQDMICLAVFYVTICDAFSTSSHAMLESLSSLCHGLAQSLGPGKS